MHAIVERVISTWEDRVSAALEQTYGPAEGRRLLTRYIRSESRSGMYRESTSPDDVPEDLRRLESMESQLQTYVRGISADSISSSQPISQPLSEPTSQPSKPKRSAATALSPAAGTAAM